MVIVVNEVLVPFVDHVDKPLECLEAAVFVPKLLDDLSAGIAIGLGDNRWEVQGSIKPGMYLVAVIVCEYAVDLRKSFASVEDADWVGSGGSARHGREFWCGCSVHCEARYADC